MRPEWGEAKIRAVGGASAGGRATWNAAVSSLRAAEMGYQAFMRPYWGWRGRGQTAGGVAAIFGAPNALSHSSGVIGGS